MTIEETQKEWTAYPEGARHFECHCQPLRREGVYRQDWENLVSRYNAAIAELEELKRTTYVRAVPRFPHGTEIGPVVE